MTFYQIMFALWTFIRQYSQETQGKLWNAIFEWAFKGTFYDEAELLMERDAYALYLTATTMIKPKGSNKGEK